MPADFLLSPTTPFDLAILRQLLTSTTRVVLATEAYAALPPPIATTADELRAHACGTGAEVPGELVRLLLLLRVRSLSPTAATVATAQRLLDFYNREILPVVYQQGGDAVALAHLCLPLLGQGEVHYQGYRLQAADVLHLFSWAPLTLTEAETTALLADAPLTLTYAAHGLMRAQHLARVAASLAGLSFAAGSATHAAQAAGARNALDDVQQVVEAACTMMASVDESGLLLALDTLRLAAVRLGELAAQRATALLADTDAAVALRYWQLTATDIRRQNQQLKAMTTLPVVLDNVEQLLGLELLLAVRSPARNSGAPITAAFREQALQVTQEQLPAVALRAAAAFVRRYEQP